MADGIDEDFAATFRQAFNSTYTHKQIVSRAIFSGTTVSKSHGLLISNEADFLRWHFS